MPEIGALKQRHVKNDAMRVVSSSRAGGGGGLTKTVEESHSRTMVRESWLFQQTHKVLIHFCSRV